MILDFIIKIKAIKDKIIIVFDQYKIGFDINYQLLNILQSEKYLSKFKFIICSSINEKDIKSNLTYSTILKSLQMKNILNYTFIGKLFSVKTIIKNDKIKKFMEKFNYIPKYYYSFIKKYHDDIEKVNNNELLETKLNEFASDQFYIIKNKLISFFDENNIDLIENYNIICQILEGEPINDSHFANFIRIIPLKYCKYKVLSMDRIKISASFDFFYLPLRAVYKEKTKIDLISVSKITNNRGELGNIFDSLVNYHFDINKNAFGFEISHVIIVNEIVNFSYFTSIINDNKDYFSRELNLENLFDGKPIYLEQKNANGQCVDGGFLIPISESNCYSLLLYQSSIKKRRHFSKEFIYNYIYSTAKENLNKMFGIDITKLYFMYIIDIDDKNTINFCKDNNIYYIIYDYKNSKFLFSNNKEIKVFNEKILASLEIERPNPKIIEIIEKMEINNDISKIKNFLLNKKRFKDNNSQKNNESEDINGNSSNITNIKENIKWCEEKKGYTNIEIKFINVNMKKYEEEKKEKKEKYITSGKEIEAFKEIPIPTKWVKIFKGYDYYCCIQKNITASNARFKLPIFYIFENKYIIIKEQKFLFYDMNSGNKIINTSELRNALDSINPFCVEDDNQVFLDAYYLDKNKKK